IRAIGPAAVPMLLRMLRMRQTVMDRLLMRLNRMQPLVRFSIKNAKDEQLRAWAGFKALGEQGESAIPELGRMLTDNRSPDFVPYLLADISTNSVPVLLNALPRVAPARRCVI